MDLELEIKTKSFSNADIRAVAALHAQAIAGGFLSTLPQGFLALLYAQIVQSPYSVLTVAVYRGNITGFIAGTLNAKRLYSDFLKNNLFRAGFHLLPWVFSARFLRKVFETLTYTQNKTAALVTESELVSMAVSENVRGRGIAQALFDSFVEEQKKIGADSFRIVAGQKLEAANRFYLRMGANKVGEIEVHAGDISNLYLYKLDTAEKK